jgi:hypothetical protein
MSESILKLAPLFEMGVNNIDTHWSPNDVVAVTGIGIFPISKTQWREEQIEELFR